MNTFIFETLSQSEQKRPQNPEYTQLSRNISNIKQQFKKTLSAEEYKKLEQLEDLQAQACELEAAEIFEQAFCTGALIMADVFEFKEKTLNT